MLPARRGPTQRLATTSLGRGKLKRYSGALAILEGGHERESVWGRGSRRRRDRAIRDGAAGAWSEGGRHLAEPKRRDARAHLALWDPDVRHDRMGEEPGQGRAQSD